MSQITDITSALGLQNCTDFLGQSFISMQRKGSKSTGLGTLPQVSYNEEKSEDGSKAMNYQNVKLSANCFHLTWARANDLGQSFDGWT
ncbi:hypothetical protein CEXT_261381 [Caerostris extrusa]|uniref:Uncharacterized protein n=1 Tax=Caerostris extrusa TaxID=172846 RepID=A0AAV4U0E2_CAEEX|nr:hypothetical protein CEXT_261381 [Caerostris extrusa]